MVLRSFSTPFVSAEGIPQAGHHVSSVNRQTLMLRGSLELTELVDNPHFVMILELEYLVKWGTGEVPYSWFFRGT